MGNSASKAEDDEMGGKIEEVESVLSGSKGASYENDSLTCPDSKSTLGTEFTGMAFTDNIKRKDSRVSSPAKRSSGNNSKASWRANRKSRDEMNNHPTSHITDDQVHVNLAMADLMAYLQVVANSSNNLPLTRRDDPELGRTVSNLNVDEYARKSAAFVPSDVRVIGGAFTRYGRVWDLPTSEEFDACDGAQEPGKLSCST